MSIGKIFKPDVDKIEKNRSFPGGIDRF